MTFDYEAQGFDVRPGIVAAQRDAWAMLGRPGSWWTGAERIALAEQVRAARLQRAKPPWLRELPDAPALPAAAVEAARKIAADAPKIDRAWVEAQIGGLTAEVEGRGTERPDEGQARPGTRLAEAAYIEVAAIAVAVCAIDTYAEALGRALEPFPAPEPGEPDRQCNPEATEAGAYVPLQAPWQGPNVARALSLVPPQNMMFFRLVMEMYGGDGRDFYELVWPGPLDRPQIELLASRVSAVNECFY